MEHDPGSFPIDGSDSVESAEVPGTPAGLDIESIFTAEELYAMRDSAVGVLSNPDAWIAGLTAGFPQEDLADAEKRQEIAAFITNEGKWLYV